MGQKTRAVTDASDQARYDERTNYLPQDVSSLLTVQRHFGVSGKTVAEEETTEVVQVKRFEVEPAEVGLELSVTVNLGDYASTRATVSYKVPCYVEESEAAWQVVENFVKKAVAKERDEIVAWADKKRKNVKNIF